jgi:hypothetical protein
MHQRQNLLEARKLALYFKSKGTNSRYGGEEGVWKEKGIKIKGILNNRRPLP